MALTPTKLLDAVNTCLAAVGESPVSTTVNVQSVAVVLALQFIEERSRALQARSWKFNSDYDYLMGRDNDNKIAVPLNAVRIDSTREFAIYDIVVRGAFLYDRTLKQYTFDRSIKVDITWMFDFEELPQHARWYITVEAARSLQARILNSRELGQYTEEDAQKAAIAFHEAEDETADFNVFRDSYSVNSMLVRSPTTHMFDLY